MEGIFYTCFNNWEGQDLFSIEKPQEDMYDHLHTFMICEELNALGELKVLDYVLCNSYNSKLEVKATEILSPISHLIARLEYIDEVSNLKLIGIYSKDAVWAISSRLIKAINSFNKVTFTTQKKWRSIPIENYMSLYLRDINSLVKVFAHYMIDNTCYDSSWSRHADLTHFGIRLFTYPVNYMFSMLRVSQEVKKYIRHCVPRDVNLRKLLMINLPSFLTKNKYKSALYFESNDKFIPRFLTKLELYAYDSAHNEECLDLYWSDDELIQELYENSNKEGRKAINKMFKIK